MRIWVIPERSEVVVTRVTDQTFLRWPLQERLPYSADRHQPHRDRIIDHVLPLSTFTLSRTYRRSCDHYE